MSTRHYRITERQREILAEAQLDADLTITDLAKRARVPEFTVRRNLNSLHEQGILDKLWYLNPFANGFGVYDILLEVIPAFLPKLQKLISFLVSMPEVEFVTELSGRFLLCVTVRCRSAQDAASLIGRICEAHPSSIGARDVSTILALTDVPIFRSVRPSRRKTRLSFVSSAIQIELDPLDERILSLMRSDPNVSLTRIARSLAIPATTVAYRVKALKERGAIVGARLFIDMFRLGYFFAVHRVVLTGENASDVEEIESRIQSIPGVYFTSRCLGRWDISFGSVTRDMNELTNCTTSIAALVGSQILNMETTHIKRFYKLNGARYKVPQSL
jgi:DNA-binding Lrp family transcriptional regulator